MMQAKLIYAKWPKLKYQPQYFLPPHGPVVMAAALPDYVDLSFIDENVEPINFEEDGDVEIVFISVMLTCQMPRSHEIADIYREMGKTVIFGGISTQLHWEETMLHSDAVFLGEVEGRLEGLLDDYRKGQLKKVYDYSTDFPDIALVGTARRDILNRELYNHRGVQMVDLVHASRGCIYNCFPCCVQFLGGRPEKNLHPRNSKISAQWKIALACCLDYQALINHGKRVFITPLYSSFPVILWEKKAQLFHFMGTP